MIIVGLSAVVQFSGVFLTNNKHDVVTFFCETVWIVQKLLIQLIIRSINNLLATLNIF